MCWIFFQPPKPEPLPNPNGYDDFVAAGEMLKGEVPDEKAGTLEECREFVSANRPALDRGRLGLTRECRVPTEFSSTWLEGHIRQIMATRKLGHAFCVEGELAKLEKRPTDAAACHLDAIKMGAMLAHGGLMIDGLIATACEGEGEMFLEPEIETLNIDQSRKLITELEKVQSQQECPTEIIKHEKMWMRSALRNIEGIKMFVRESATARSLNPGEADQKLFLTEYDARLQWTLQLQAKLAAHSYALEQGHLPTNWNEVVPAYLKSVPSVPFGPSDTNRLNFKSN